MSIKDIIDKIPNRCGIYLMKDSYGNIIYVGKSKNLNSRVKSYFRTTLNRSRKIERLVRNIKDIDFIITDTELDALLLECEYIHKFRPMYNTLMNNYEQYKYIKLNKNSLNIIDIVDEKDDEGIYFGPYSMNKRLFQLREFLLEYFKLPTCTNKAKCIRYNINKCLGPCRVDTKDEYDKIYNSLKGLFTTEDHIIMDMRNTMEKEASILNFERAQFIKKNIDLLDSIRNKEYSFKLIEEKKKMILWMKLKENQYKIYYINGIKVKFTKIIDLNNFNNEDASKLIKEIIEIRLKENEKVRYDKSYIDYLNIIYGYIKNKDYVYTLEIK